MLLISSQEFTIGTIADNHFKVLNTWPLVSAILLFNVRLHVKHKVTKNHLFLP